MAKGKTLWEMLLAKVHGPVELHYYNPLKAKVGSSILINDIDLRDFNFFIKEIRQYSRVLDGKQFLFVDYVLLARPLHGEDVWVRLRLNPVDDPEAAAGLTHTALLLRLYDEMATTYCFFAGWADDDCAHDPPRCCRGRQGRRHQISGQSAHATPCHEFLTRERRS